MEWILGGSTWGFFRSDESASWILQSDAVQAIVTAGFGVEVWPTRGQDDPDPIPAEVERIREACAEAPFVSVHMRGRFWSWDPAHFRKEIDFAAAVGGETLVVHPICLGLSDPDDRLDRTKIERVAGYGAERGVRLALENVRNSAWALDRALDVLGDDPAKTNLGICIDVGHAFLSEDVESPSIRGYLGRYERQVLHLHLHDNDGREDEHLPPGAGKIEWDLVREALRGIGFAGSAVLEVHRAGEDPVRTITESGRFLRSST